MEKKSVLFVYHTLHIGGVEKELLAILKYLKIKHIDMHLALTRIEGELIKNIPKNVTVHQIKGDSLKPDFWYLISFFSLVKKIKPKIIIGFMQDINFNILLFKFFFHKKYKVLASEHIILSEWQRVTKTHWLKRKMINFLYQQADMFLAPSQNILNDLHAYLKIPPSKMYLLPNFVDPQVSLKKKILLGRNIQSKKFFLFVGRLNPQKNLLLLFKAFKIITDEYSDIYLVLLGPERNKDTDKICHHLKIENKVLFQGYKRNPFPYYKKAIGLILPSKVEGNPRVVIEAMLSDCAIIISDFVGYDSLVIDKINGLVFKKNSILGLVDCMKIFLKNKQALKYYRKNAKINITKTYNSYFLQNYSNSLNSFFHKLLT